jgi:hypothetical protein
MKIRERRGGPRLPRLSRRYGSPEKPSLKETHVKSPCLLALAASAVVSTFPLLEPALAGDVQGDAYSCQELWVMRNQVYKDNAYCFRSERAVSYFGIGGCVYQSEDAVPLSKSERRLVDDIKASEGRQGC